jgi:type IX secretion system PorP/SprF family membrane protein
MQHTKKIFCIAFLVLFTLGKIAAQQDPMFSQYMFNTLIINPAYAGSADKISAVAVHRSQWVKFEGAPVTQTISVHSPLRSEAISVGGSIINDKYGPVRQTAIFGDVSYRIIMPKSKLAFGLKTGMNLFSANLTDLNPLVDNDQAFSANIKTKVLPNFGFGAMWYSKRWFVGLSSPRLIQNKLIKGDLPDFQYNREKIHGFLIAGYVMDINDYVKFKPTMLLKMVNGAPPGIDLTANFLFYEKLWFGGMYRWNDSAGLLIQYEMNNKFRFGYAYDYILSDLSRYTSGSHEVMIGYDLGNGFRGDVSPRYF